MKEKISRMIKEHENLLSSLEIEKIMTAADMILHAYQNNNKVITLGNGGSASDAEHFAAELVGRFKLERKPRNAIALSTNSSTVTAIANDYGYEKVFSRQIEAYAEKNDVVIGISTSGNSKNVINALKKAKEMGCKTIGLIGKKGGEQKKFCDIAIVVDHDDTARIQEMHILIMHILCELIENSL